MSIYQTWILKEGTLGEILDNLLSLYSKPYYSFRKVYLKELDTYIFESTFINQNSQ